MIRSWIVTGLLAGVSLATFAATPSSAADVDVFILAGQSNAGGHGYFAKEFAYYSQFQDAGLVELGLTQWAKPQPGNRVWVWGGNVPSKEFPVLWTQRTVGWLPMRAGYDSQDRAGKVMKHQPFGVEVTFAARLRDLRPDRSIAVVKYTQGATKIGTDWDPVPGRAYDVAAGGGAGHCYAGMMSCVREATQALVAAGDTYTIRGLLWIQGESDAGMKPDEYRARLGTLVAAVREDLKAPALPVAVGELLAINPEFKSLRGGQRAWVASDPHAVLVVSEGLTADHTFGGKLHVDTKSLLEFGRRFADALAPKIGPASTTGPATMPTKGM